MVKKILVVIISFFIANSLNALSSYIVMDASSGRVLEGNNIDSQSLIASTTKIMTTLIALEYGNLENKCIVGDEIDSVDGSMIYAKKGEKFTLRDLLYGLNLVSGNDAAQIIASNVTSYDNFIKLMNKKAAVIGMKNTIFKNPHGLDEVTQNYSTAYDLAILMRYIMKNEEYKVITKTRKYKVSTDKNTYIWYNKNKLLGIYENADGGKIGYTPSSGHVFVSHASLANEQLIVVTFKSSDQFNEHKKIYEKYFKEYDTYKIVNKYNAVINDKKHKNYHLYINNDINIMLKKFDKIKLNYVIYNNIKNKNAGYIDVIVNDEKIMREDIYATKRESKMKKLKNLLLFWK